jgi:hypothetical protein
MLQFITHSVHIFTNTNRTESYEQHSFSRVGAGAGAAGAASKFLPGAGAGNA